jgi:hypothetical protein
MSVGGAPSSWLFCKFALFVTGDGERDFLPLGLEARASVHFLVNMIEAYYFADAPAVNAVLGTEMVDFAGDVETIPHPKNRRKEIVAGLGRGRSFDEVEHGRAIVERLNVAKVLGTAQTCRSLRTAFAWCRRAMGLPATELFRLADGQLSPITGAQLDRLSGQGNT